MCCFSTAGSRAGGVLLIALSIACGHWVEACECLSVSKLKSGEYLILQEEDGRGKNLLHRWKPGVITTPTRGN
jgi:hypothetical protein